MPTSGSCTILTRRRHIGSTVMLSAIASFGWPSRRPIGIGQSLGVTNTTPERMVRNVAEGRTAMIRVGDHIEYEGKVFTTLGQLFDDVHHQTLAVGIPCRPDYSKQEEEILMHLTKLARDKKNDTVWLPASMLEARQVLNPSHPWYRYDDQVRHGRDRSSSCDSRMPILEPYEPDPSAPESTDTEMYQALEKDLLVSSDYQVGMVRDAAQRDVRNIQFKELEEEVCHRAPGHPPRVEG